MSERHPDPVAIERLVGEYEGALLRYAASICSSSHAAQDVVQEVFLRMVRAWQGRFEPHSDLENWLFHVAHNCAVDHIRRETRRADLHARHAEAARIDTPPPRPRPPSDRAEAAMAAMKRLTFRERELVTLKVLDGKSYKEISEITGLTVTNVGFHLHQAMRKLAQALGVTRRNRTTEERPTP